MTEPTYDNYYPTRPATGLTAAQEVEYAAFFPDTTPPEPEREKPDALTSLNQAIEAIEASNNYPKDNT